MKKLHGLAGGSVLDDQYFTLTSKCGNEEKKNFSKKVVDKLLITYSSSMLQFKNEATWTYKT